MGDFKEHVLFGFLTASVAAYFLKQNLVLAFPEVVISSIGIFIGSVISDIDHKKAYVHRAVKSFSSIGLGGVLLFFLPFRIHQNFIAASGAFLIVYTSFSAVKMRHRGFTHSLSFLAIVSSLGVISGVLLFSSIIPGLAVGLGVFSHLVLDGEFKLT